jgi:hypothetical protein
MDRAALLERTRNSIADSERRIVRQREIIEELEADRRDTTGQQLILELFEDLQSAYATVRDRLLEARSDLAMSQDDSAQSA